MSRVLRGEAGRRATAETFGLPLPDMAGNPQSTPADPFAAARAAGFQEGFQAGLADAASGDEAAKAARVARLSDALITAAVAARSQRAEAVALAEHEAVDLAFELAQALLGREISLSPSLSIEAVSRAVALVPKGEDLVVRLHPGDVITPEDLQALVADASIKVVHDPEVEEGGCIVEAGPCRIDAQIGPAMERARALINSVGQGTRGSA
ncbi:MAG TPA: FliH/SctL family protein [Acidimicrobiales bacterium]|nr:FliH/SctL family protein [Acidimicrobiales bacterium]